MPKISELEAVTSPASTSVVPIVVDGVTKKVTLANLVAAGGGGGGGTPGGSDTQVQFNDSSAFGGDAGLTFNKTTNVLTASGGIATGADPSTLGAGIDMSSGDAIASRNAGDNDNVNLIGLTDADIVQVGDLGYDLELRAGSGRDLTLQSDTHSIKSGNGATTFAEITSAAFDLKLTATSATGNVSCKGYSDVADTQTSDVTPAPIFTWTITDDAVTMVTVEALAIKSDGSASASYVRRCRIRNDDGTVTVGSVVDVGTDEEAAMSGCDVTIDDASGTGTVSVTGLGSAVDWGVIVTRLELVHS